MQLLKAFGKKPSGELLEELKKSSQYKDGEFHNFSNTIMMAGNESFLTIMWRFMNKPANTKPPKEIPSVITDLRYPVPGKSFLCWFGHSSYLIHLDGFNVLVDPVFSGYASPFPLLTKSFPGTEKYGPGDMPDIDLLILTHDHYDHLDYRTIVALKPSIKKICTSLGVSSHLAYWGLEKKFIQELDWWESIQINQDLELSAAPARHFSGRTFDRNKTLWSSFVLKKDAIKIYIGGDSGYDSHFRAIGEKFGSMDLAILESGQYNQSWPQIHMMPEETVQAAMDLNAKVLLPVHWGKFSLSLHPWDEPIKRVLIKAGPCGLQVATPMIGEPFYLQGPIPQKEWWNL
ncbi:MAG: MBL fold metallo-hydrolase [Bacteroidetes bacterium]|nr:MAG: MBL fold metallo-hydrolase [Bacteroidota bacterium]